MARTFRQLYRHLLPSWLGGTDAGGNPHDGTRVAHSLSLIVDAMVERMRLALDARLPSRSGASALALHGRDRGIMRGRSETAAHYAQRLIRWRWPRGHRVRGSAFGLLEQIAEYWGGLLVWTIDVSRNRHVRAADGAESYSYAYAWDWDGEPASPNWGRFWVVIGPSTIFSAQPDFGDAALWGGALGTPGHTIGQQGATPEDVLAMRRLVRGSRPWKPAGTRAEWLIVNLDGTTQTPDGTWLNWSKNVGGTQVAARYSGWRYWSLSPETNNVYAGDSNNYPTLVTMVDGTTEAGDSSVWLDVVPLPDGSTYAGDSATFPLTARLIDDGDAPQ